MEPWNQTVLKPPPSVSIKIVLTQEIRGAFEFLERVLRKQVDSFSEPLRLLRGETAFVAQLYYKLSSVFRHDKAVKSLKKCLKTAERLRDIELNQLLLDFKQQVAIGNSSNVVYGPNCSLLEHLLLRLQGATRLAAQLVAYTQHCGSLFLQKLSLGHFVNINVLSLASAARLWATSLSLVPQLMTTFTEMHKTYSSKLLPDSHVDYLPPEYQFPHDIREWLRSSEDLRSISILFVDTEDKTEPARNTSDFWGTLTGIQDATPEVKSVLQSDEMSKAAPDFKDIDIGEAIVRGNVQQSSKRKKNQKNRGGKRLRE